MGKKLKILFLTLDGVGHINAAIGMAQILIDAGHECWFGIKNQWTDYMAQYVNIKTYVWPLSMTDNNDSSNSSSSSGVVIVDKVAQWFMDQGIIGDQLTPIEKIIVFGKWIHSGQATDGNVFDVEIDKAIRRVKPDIILCDLYTTMAAVVKSQIPWVKVSSSNPLTVLNDDRTPPANFGLPTNGSYNEWTQIKIKIVREIIGKFKLPLPDNWYRFDNFMRQHISSEPFELPVQLRDKPGKVIYFSLGSMGAIDVTNMKRLIAILVKSQNVFIVSKGPLGDEYDLLDNMWGQPSVPQTQVLPLVDLIITHGGNNTITECFYFGKPMIVMPLFGEQYDNAQRVHEKGFGIRLDAYKCSENELLFAIETLLANKSLAEKLQKISQRIQTENSLTKLPQLLETIIKMKILFVPLESTGHINSAIGQAQVLIGAGHECWIVVSNRWHGSGELESSYGLKIYQWLIPQIIGNGMTTNDNDDDDDDGNVKSDAQLFMELGVIGGQLTAKEKLIVMANVMISRNSTIGKIYDNNVGRAICQIKPDVILCDQVRPLASVVKSQIPWVMVSTCNPLTVLNDDKTPPPLLGLPTNGSLDEWKQIKIDIIREILGNFKFYLNIYDFPLELDYQDIRPLPDNWYRFDNFMRQHISSEPFELPIQLRDKPGKVIYFSLGSMGAIDVNNMKRLIAILEKSPNVFIVSKGPLGDEYDLPDNMWGQPSVPQTQVLPLVDLVITHGGNNTITECFYFGKPMIVMPLFVDQYDNAQRVDEKGFGIRLDAYKCSENELLFAIETLLANKSLAEKLQKISQRIQTENSLTKLPQLLESLVENNLFKQNTKTDSSCQIL
ncbi:uncharacterized protein LOC128951430 [Oppia nitens]|uniref:uncharacterized protein LOC128951430 n=1 Tax=Oppia nitens TaxID=1686743 RepID=UPI0023DAEC76|nr:uncharacterized protein LOC128951430 [Oppia nitens]